MITVDQFLKALAIVESSDNPEAWGDAGRACGRWQCHPDRLWFEANRLKLPPKLGETYDQWFARIVTVIFTSSRNNYSEVQIAMYWHKQFWGDEGDQRWDAKYSVRFIAAMANAVAELP